MESSTNNPPAAINPQKENGYMPIANEIVEALARTNLGCYESRVLWAVLRKTYGWGKKEDKTPLSQLADLTGMSKSHVCRAKAKLLKRNIIAQTGKGISFNKFYTGWRSLPKQVTQVYPLPKQATVLPKQAKKALPKQGPSKDNTTKDTSSKAIAADKPPRPLGKHLYPLVVFVLCRKIHFDNHEQVDHIIERYTKTSKSLKGYSPRQIIAAMLYAEQESKGEYDVTLETVAKKIIEYKDQPIPAKYEQAVHDIISRFEKEKDILLSKTSPLIHAK